LAKTPLVSQDNKREILYNVINSALAGSLVFLGGMMNSGDITWKVAATALMASAVVGVTKFQTYWSREEQEYTGKKGKAKKKNPSLFCFLP
jgi:hypothetical protein